MFQKDFLWGAASAAHQVEGAYLEDGKGMGYWDELERKEGQIAHGDRAEIGCDHYHRYKEDVALMKQMGLKSYRFSISWPRVLPEGVGRINEKGLQFYSDLVDELLCAGIEPIVTLYHWNIPLVLHERGGWNSEDSPAWFAEFVEVVVKKLSDRVKYWITFNEPQMFAGIDGMKQTEGAAKEDRLQTLMELTRHILIAHGKAVTAIRNFSKQPAMVSMAPTGSTALPKSLDAASIEEARKKSFQIDERTFLFSNAWWADPVYLGRFSDETVEVFGNLLPEFSESQWEEISQPLDYYGCNVYHALYDFPEPRYSYNEYGYPGCPRTGTDLIITPEVMYWSARFFHERYGLPIMVTENGMAGMDWISLDGKVHDPQRIDYMERYLLHLKRAVDEGIPVLGYQHWSILDNFEWVSGFDKRFGLIYIDYRTKERTLKDSAYWYRKVIQTNGSCLTVAYEA